jgi:hypothetical protein
VVPPFGGHVSGRRAAGRGRAGGRRGAVGRRAGGRGRAGRAAAGGRTGAGLPKARRRPRSRPRSRSRSRPRSRTGDADPVGRRAAARAFFSKHKATIERLVQDGHNVKAVVGCAKELLDARMLLGHRWVSSDNETRVVKRIIMSGWRLLPRLADWQGKDGFGMGEGWSYDPFGKFSGEDLLPPSGR